MAEKRTSENELSYPYVSGGYPAIANLGRNEKSFRGEGMTTAHLRGKLALAMRAPVDQAKPHSIYHDEV